MSAGNPNAPTRIPARIARLTTLSRINPKNALMSPGAAQRYLPNEPPVGAAETGGEGCTGRSSAVAGGGVLVRDRTVTASREAREDDPLAEERATPQNAEERTQTGATVLLTPRRHVVIAGTLAAALVLSSCARTPGNAVSASNGTTARASEIPERLADTTLDRKSTRLNSSHSQISYAVFCLKK